MNFKNIHIGKLIEKEVLNREIESSRICNFFNASEKDILNMYECEDLDTKNLLRWSKLLEYDFFRIYSQHLILYAPQERFHNRKKNEVNHTVLPKFRKNIYTNEVIEFLLELIISGAKTKTQVIEEYGIPKTTLHKWITKRKTFNDEENISFL
ncbi:transposase [Chryseobacterium candidae]|uniref:Transposase n=1 Tax=Chryseobacterium candidae TaxID=1978493 RepID=A0ABY2R6U6_9FLAO|nr:transposase [Chryseobacterium candidae]THV59379.1 transposase [Chryseobacterium candidae]